MKPSGRTVEIKYVHHHGGAFQDKRHWQGKFTDNGEIYDWNTVKALIHSAWREGHSYRVMRLDRKTRKYVLSYGRVNQ